MNLSAIREDLKLGDACFNKLMEAKGEFTSVLDIGGGDGRHSNNFFRKGYRVTFVDFRLPDPIVKGIDYIACDFMKAYAGEHDLVWCCHVLEHQVNVNLFLLKLLRSVAENGLIAITIPPAKHNIVGGHVSIWNAGLLMYNLVLAGQSCREAKIVESGYNISLIVRKSCIEISKGDLVFDYGDINHLKEYFPVGLEWGDDTFNGDIKELNWY